MTGQEWNTRCTMEITDEQWLYFVKHTLEADRMDMNELYMPDPQTILSHEDSPESTPWAQYDGGILTLSHPYNFCFHTEMED